MNPGACLCGAVRYELDGPYSFATHCHCSMCRKHHGSAFATFVGAPAAGFRWLVGEAEVVTYTASEHWLRPFCRHCGSVTPVLRGETVIAPAGNLTGELGIRPQSHMFAGSIAPWHRITDDLPQHDAYPPDDETPSTKRPVLASRDGIVLGSCLCGEVQFQLEGTAEMMRHCHCTRCQRARSAAHATNLFYPRERLRFTRGRGAIETFDLPDAERFGNNFCRTCGSLVPREKPDRPYATIPAGSLDTEPGTRATEHIYVSSIASWFEITDDLPQHPEMPN